MQTWVTLAAKHATFASGIGLGAIPATGWDSLDGVAIGFLLAGAGFAAVNSTRQTRSCALPPAASAGPAMAESSRQGARALTRIRRRVDGLLTSMLNDDSELQAVHTPVLVPLPSAIEPQFARQAAAGSSRWGGDYVDAVAGPATRIRAARPVDAVCPEPEGRPERVGSWPYLTVVRDSDDRPDVVSRLASPGLAAGERTRADEGDQAFWGPKPAGAAAGGDAGRRRHRADALATAAAGTATTRASDGRRPGGRHAAPPAGFGATIGRRLTSPRFTSKSAAHAG